MMPLRPLRSERLADGNQPGFGKNGLQAPLRWSLSRALLCSNLVDRFDGNYRSPGSVVTVAEVEKVHGNDLNRGSINCVARWRWLVRQWPLVQQRPAIISHRVGFLRRRFIQTGGASLKAIRFLGRVEPARAASVVLLARPFHSVSRVPLSVSSFG
jgi:hypothetical protein